MDMRPTKIRQFLVIDSSMRHVTMKELQREYFDISSNISLELPGVLKWK